MCVCVCVCVCVSALEGGRTILKRETRMGPGPPWSPGAPPKSVQRTIRAPPCSAPIGVAAGGLAWVRTSSGVGLCDLRPGASMPASMPGRVMLGHSRPLRAGGGGGSGCPHPLLKAWPPLTDACWRRLGCLAEGSPPPPGVRSPAALALPSAPGGIGRATRQRILGSHRPPCHRRMVITTLSSMFCLAAGGCPVCRLAQQCRTPLPTAAHVAHCL